MYSNLGESYSPVVKITYFEGAMTGCQKVHQWRVTYF